MCPVTRDDSLGTFPEAYGPYRRDDLPQEPYDDERGEEASRRNSRIPRTIA
jgi:hypothetical protein